jgi:predicted Zn-dependent protease
MKNIKSVLFITVITIVISCSKVPITGRKQLNIVPDGQMMEMSFSQYRQFLTEHPPLPSSDANVQMVQRVGSRISQGVDNYFRQQKQMEQIQGYKWEFNVVDDKQVNAWCMPGGKVVVYTGLLPITQNETALAVVMGHEIAHAVAKHGNERMSQGLAAQGFGIALDVALSQKPQETRNLFLQSFNVGATLGLLKYSRTQESEADKLGLVFMAMAGYNPTEAIAFWQRMAAQSKGGGELEILRTHPSDETRIRDIKAYMPQAMKYYKPS